MKCYRCDKEIYFELSDRHKSCCGILYKTDKSDVYAKSILDADIEFYQASLESAQRQLGTATVDEESTYKEIIKTHYKILDAMLELKKQYEGLNYA